MSKEEVLSTIGTMKGHIERLERYVHSMSSIQKLEDIKPAASSVSGDVFLSGLEETAQILCEKKRLIFKAKASAYILRLDTEMVSQVFENLIVNAVRYAKETIAVCGEMTDAAFTLSVTDDGNGFTEEALKKVTEPFYRDEKASGKIHFGLGLYTCKLLCEKHGGQLTLVNLPSGGAKITAIFRNL